MTLYNIHILQVAILRMCAFLINVCKCKLCSRTLVKLASEIQVS